ncbi:hypothetical protein HRG_013782 [Hirsutella rhossiliensis]
MPAYEYCCKCGGMIVISTTCTGCGHKQCNKCPLAALLLHRKLPRYPRCISFRPSYLMPHSSATLSAVS